jgi:HEAT repeat protein
MKQHFASLLKIYPGEDKLVALLGGMMLLTAAGSAMGGASIDALFFTRYGVQSLPVWYIVLGIVNFVNLILVAGIAGRVSRRRLYLTLPIILAGVMLAARGLLMLNLRWIYPVLYIGKEVVNALQSVFLWGLASSLLDARQSKRLFPLFMAGGLAGSMLGSFGMPPLVRAFGAEAMLVGWSLALGATAWLCFRLIQRNRRSLEARASSSSGQNGIASLLEEIQAGYRYVRRSSLLKWFSFASLLFSVLWFALMLPFSRVSNSQFPDADQLASFFGLFQGAWTAAALLASLLLTSRLFSRIGVINTLVIYPFIYLIGFGALAIFASFPLIVIVRFIQIFYGSSLAETAWQASFNAIPSERRDQARAFINAVPGQAGVILSGLILVIGEQTLQPQQLFGVGLVMAGLLAWVLLRSKRAYVQALNEALISGQPLVFFSEEEPFGGFQNDPAALAVLQAGLGDSDPGRRRLSAEIMGNLPAEQVAQALLTHLGDSEPEVRLACLAALASSFMKQSVNRELIFNKHAGFPAVSACLSDPDPDVRQQAIKSTLVLHWGEPGIRNNFQPLLKDAIPTVQIQAARALIEMGVLPESAPLSVLTALAGSSELEDRRKALAVLGEIWKPASPKLTGVLDILLKNLNDPQPTIRQTVLDSIEHPPLEICPRLLQVLEDKDPQVRASAARALIRLGQAGLPDVLKALNDPAKEADVLSVLGGLAAQAEQVNLHNLLMGYIAHKVDIAQKDHVLWRYCLSADGERIRLLVEALEHRSQNQAVLGLQAFAVIHPKAPVELAIQSMQSSDPRQKAYALETLEAVNNSQAIRPLLELWETRESNNLCESPILTALQDPDPWMRACAAFAARENPDPEVAVRLTELAQNDPDELVRMTACANGENIMETLQTLSTMDRILFLRKVPLFAGQPPLDLKHIASIATERFFPDGALISRQGDVGDMLFIIASGQVRVTSSGKELAVRQSGDSLGEMAIISQAPRMATLTAVGDVRLLCVGQKEFEAVLRQRPEVSLAVMRVMCSRLNDQVALIH